MARSARWHVVATVVLAACGSRPLQQRDGGGTGNIGAVGGNGGGAGSVGTTDASADAAAVDADDARADGGICPPIADAGRQPECANGIDDDGDGLVDAMDPDCTTPYDDSETLFRGVPGDFETCRRDCQFDSNTGQGDDLCDWPLRCDPLAPMPRCGDASSTACSPAVTQHCRDFCLPRTPNGCDCFGCCAVDVAGARRAVLISEGISCSSDTLSDPVRCPSCTQNTDCLNPCLPGEVCFAGAAPVAGPLTELAPRCLQGQVACGPGAMPPCLCPTGTYCVTGCCVPFSP
jgi:hypothetical protein